MRGVVKVVPQSSLLSINKSTKLFQKLYTLFSTTSSYNLGLKKIYAQFLEYNKNEHLLELIEVSLFLVKSFPRENQ
jgi:hypothetical protein